MHTKDKKLLFSVTLSDCKIQAGTSNKKAGGQFLNRTNSKIEILHEPSGVRTESGNERSQLQNKKSAFLKLANHPEFRKWLKIEATRILGQPSIEEIVDRKMTTNNLKLEIKDENQCWREISFEDFEKLQKENLNR